MGITCFSFQRRNKISLNLLFVVYCYIFCLKKESTKAHSCLAIIRYWLYLWANVFKRYTENCQIVYIVHVAVIVYIANKILTRDMVMNGRECVIYVLFIFTNRLLGIFSPLGYFWKPVPCIDKPDNSKCILFYTPCSYVTCIVTSFQTHQGCPHSFLVTTP